MLLLLLHVGVAKRSQTSPALVTFVTAGYPTVEDTVPILLSMQEGGADIIELGVPFSDPIADGPAIQESNVVRHFFYRHRMNVWRIHGFKHRRIRRSERFTCNGSIMTGISPLQVALKNNVDYVQCLGMVREARSKGLTTPVLLMGELASWNHNLSDLSTASIQGTITPSLRMAKTRPSKMPPKQVRMVIL